MEEKGMIETVEETCTKECYGAGNLEKETELIQEEVSTVDITRQTPFLTLYCC